jgi:hypothetical protein
MLIIRYNAYSGAPVADGNVAAFAEWHLVQHEQRGGDQVVYTSSHLVIDTFRVFIRCETIPMDQIRFEFEKDDGTLIPIKHYKNGGLRPWPEGFCDHTENLLIQLL